MLPNSDFMRDLRRQKKEESVTNEVEIRFKHHLNAMLESFSGLTLEQKLQAFQEVSTLMNAKVNGF